MQNAAFQELGLDYAYLPFRVARDDLERAIEGVKALGIAGLNVTIPHKVAVIPLLDRLDPLAEKIGAVNTIVNSGGSLAGYNTDATGFLQALRERGIEPRGKNVVVLGAGGASRGICFILVQNGARLTLLNRTFARAQELACRLAGETGRDIKALPLNEGSLAGALEITNILVNTTSAGMSPRVDDTPVPAKLLKKELAVFDIVYNPVQTRLLREAEAAGARTINGVDMLVWQGAQAFTLWTGRDAPVEIMKREAMRALRHEV
jgi:shikimate dehydrogenase